MYVILQFLLVVVFYLNKAYDNSGEVSDSSPGNHKEATDRRRVERGS